MAREGTKPANIPEVTWPSILTQRHTLYPTPDLQMHLKGRLMKQKQNSSWSPSLCVERYWGRAEAVLAREGAWELPGRHKMLWDEAYAFSVTLDSIQEPSYPEKISPPVHTSYFKPKVPESAHGSH